METEGKIIDVRDEVHVAMAGKSGAGKSTLISNVFGVEMTQKVSAGPITTKNQTWVKEKDGIRIHVTDTVGLQVGKRKQKMLRKLAKHGHGGDYPKVDLLIYCLCPLIHHRNLLTAIQQ